MSSAHVKWRKYDHLALRYSKASPAFTAIFSTRVMHDIYLTKFKVTKVNVELFMRRTKKQRHVYLSTETGHESFNASLQ